MDPNEHSFSKYPASGNGCLPLKIMIFTEQGIGMNLPTFSPVSSSRDYFPR